MVVSKNQIALYITNWGVKLGSKKTVLVLSKSKKMPQNPLYNVFVSDHIHFGQEVFSQETLLKRNNAYNAEQ